LGITEHNTKEEALMFMLTIVRTSISDGLNHLNAELNPICHLLALLGVHHFLHVSRIRVNLLKPGPSCQKTAICSGTDFSEIKFCTQYMDRKFNDELKTIQNKFIKTYVYPVMAKKSSARLPSEGK
jgi:hypothetical protein